MNIPEQKDIPARLKLLREEIKRLEEQKKYLCGEIKFIENFVCKHNDTQTEYAYDHNNEFDGTYVFCYECGKVLQRTEIDGCITNYV